jgi:hypothetical protein
MRMILICVSLAHRIVGCRCPQGAGLGKDYLARALSSLIRSARSSKSQNEIMAIAVAHGVTSNPEFIV